MHDHWMVPYTVEDLM